MRILKYIVLLLLLGFVAVVVYIATQKGDFTVQRTHVIKSQRPAVFTYVNDYRNWEHFVSWLQNAAIDYSQVTSGKGARMSWVNQVGKTSIKTIHAKENDSLVQELEFNGEKTQVRWWFRDTVGGTSVRWEMSGRVNFTYKIKAFLQGGLSDVVTTGQEQSLANLNRVLNNEINTASIGAASVVQKPLVRYFGRTILSTYENMPRNRQILLSKMHLLFEKNNIPKSGPPFVIYHYADKPANRVKFTVGIPIPEPARSSSGSEIRYGEIPAYTSVHLTLKGDYSHRKKVWERGRQYLQEHGLSPDSKFFVIESLDKSSFNSKRPSEWVTQFYFPIRSIPEVTPVNTSEVPSAQDIE